MDAKLIKGYKELFSLKEKNQFASEFKISLEQARRIISNTPGYKNYEYYIFMQHKISQRISEIENRKAFPEFPMKATDHIA